ncbi:type IV pilus assembly protein PilM [Chryseomicrobium aureum]|uniref:type IV pilus biogenesis protein PilM n=1 Tax=Chryseomicrobium aureum TaxID=1441723 RepID=UPI00195CEA84|nr:pilus assembly protein PilM [Chryseomicrobium aureum]MBM7706670.1 type IV pilus assembly protein PilM [Chryseomicrobium aureum]
MFRKRGSRQIVSMDLHETVLRALVRPREDGDDWLLYEAAVPPGYVEDDHIKDEIGYFNWMKEQVSSWGIKRDQVRYFVPDSAVMMKAIEHPEDVETEGLKGYVQMELGRSIQLPFENPLLDVYDPTPGDQKATLFAAPAEEVMRFANILDDAGLDPVIADLRALSAIRYFTKRDYFKTDKSYLLVEWLMTGVVVTIYRDGEVEFLRYQPFEKENGVYRSYAEGDDIKFRLDGDVEAYRYQLAEQVTELERMMTFYRFSIHKGDIAVEEIVSFGESPELDYIDGLLRENLSFPQVTTVRDEDVRKFYNGFGSSDVSLIGLALKGDVHESGN